MPAHNGPVGQGPRMMMHGRRPASSLLMCQAGIEPAESSRQRVSTRATPRRISSRGRVAVGCCLRRQLFRRDEILALISLPLTNPPRESYANVVLFDDPTGYWGMGDNAFEFTHVEVQDKPPDSVPIPSDSDTGGSGGGGFDDVFGRDLAEALVAHISPGIRETYSGKVGARSRSGRRPAARA